MVGDRNGKQSTDLDREIGRQIHLVRRSKGLSRENLAKNVGVSFQQINKYETGSNRVTAARLAEIARILGTPVSHFFAAAETDVGSDGTGGLQDFISDPRAATFLACWSKLSPSARDHLCALLQAMTAEVVPAPPLDGAVADGRAELAAAD